MKQEEKDYAYKNGILKSNTPIYIDLFDAKIMGILMPIQSDTDYGDVDITINLTHDHYQSGNIGASIVMK